MSEEKKKNPPVKHMIKTLLKSVREYKKPSLVTPLFMVGEAICECLIPFVMSLMLTEPVSMEKILLYGGLLLCLAILSLTCGICGGKFAATASCGFAKNLRKDLFYSVSDFSFKDVDDFSSSSLVTRLTTDVSNVQMAYQMCLRIVIRVPLMFIFSVIMGLSINVYLTLVYIVMIPLLAAGLLIIMTKAMPLFRKIFKKYDAMNNSVQENVSGIRVVKAFVREQHEDEKFDKASSQVKKDFTKAEKLVALNSPIMQFVMYAASVIVSFVGVYIVTSQSGVHVENGSIIKDVEGALLPAQVSAILSYGVQMLSSLMMLAMIAVMLTMSVESASRITEVLDRKPSLVSPENGIKTVKNGEIEFNDVSFKYSENAEKFALSNINLKIESGQTIGIIGSTGSSKSTLVNLIPRLYDVSEGSVTVGGEDVRNYDLKVLRDSVAMVLQKNVLFSGSIKENMRWGNKNATDEEIEEACRLAQADEFIQSFPDKYDSKIEQGGVNVSGGQKQRLCIARALLKKPKILILDDSTSAVDTKTDALIRKAFKDYIPETTKIIIAQRISSIEDSDFIIVLDGGKIVECGNHEQLMKKQGIYHEIYNSQTKKGDND